MTLAAHYRDEVTRIAAMIGLARQMIAAGITVDLEPVGAEIIALCAKVARLPAPVGAELIDDLVALNARLDRLGAALVERHTLDSVRLRRLRRRRIAHRRLIRSMAYENYVQALVALVAVLALIALVAWGARRMGLAGVRGGGGRRDRRLSVSEVLAVDNRRRLLLVKRDAVEHLILIGGTGDIVVERSIQMALPSGLPRVFEDLKP